MEFMANGRCKAKRTKARHDISRRGSIVVLVLLCLVVLLAMAAFAIDVSYMQLVRTQLRRSTDSAARAGSEAVLRTQKKDAAISAAQQAAKANLVAGQPLVLDTKDIVPGTASRAPDGQWKFAKSKGPYNAVQVRGHRTANSPGGTVPLFLGSLLGRNYFEPDLTSTAARLVVPRDFGLVLDRSGSMNAVVAATKNKTRWQVLDDSVRAFLAALGDTVDRERVGIADYSNSSVLSLPLTTNYPTVETTVRSIMPTGMTNIYSGIVDGTRLLTDAEFSRAEAKKVMIVMTDGIHNTGPEPILAARAAAAQGIVIYAITFGENADIDRMTTIVAEGNGSHYHADSATELKSAFLQILTDSQDFVFVE